MIETQTSISEVCTLGEEGTVLDISVSSAAYPNAAGLNSVDFYMSFTVLMDLPVNSVLSVTPGFNSWLYSGSSIQDYCWCSHIYSDCLISNNAVKITLA